MAHLSSLVAQDGSFAGYSENSSSVRQVTSDLGAPSRVTQAWIDDQTPPGAAIHSDKSALHRHRASAFTSIEKVDDILDGFYDGKASGNTDALPQPIETSLAQQKKVVTSHVYNILEAKFDSLAGGGFTAVTSESQDTSKIIQGDASPIDAALDSYSIVSSILNETREGIIRRITAEFWTRIDNWLPNTTGCTGGPNTSDTKPDGNAGYGLGSALRASNKATRNGQGPSKIRNAGKPYDRLPNTPDKSGDSRNNRDRMLEFACPFKKRCPQRFSLDEYKSCTIGHWPSIALMKQHLTRRHKAIPGQDPMIGMSAETELWLKTEKRPGQSEVDRWKAIYEKLFPGCLVPSPYFDTLIDHYEQERAEVPRALEESLRALIAAEMQQVEEIVMGRMESFVRSLQEHAIPTYRASYNLEIEPESQEDLGVSLTQPLPSHPDNSETNEISNNGEFSTDNDSRTCGCHGLCTCSINVRETATLARPTIAQDFDTIDSTGNGTNEDAVRETTTQAPMLASPEAAEDETWLGWINHSPEYQQTVFDRGSTEEE